MEKSNRLYVMVGIPGSGKSYFLANNNLVKPYKVVSRDKIRFSLVKEEEEYFSKEKEVFNKFIKEIKDGLDGGFNVYADATHINEASRTKLLRALGSSLKGIKVEAIVIKPPFDIIEQQNAQRTGREFVPLSAIRRMNYQFTMPTCEEGFNKVWIVTNKGGVSKK